MVHLILSSTKGNQGVRYFPYSGYLGLTPVKVEGVVRTQLDSDLKPLQAKSITISVRCYESRLGRVRVLYSNILVDHTQVLWNKPDDRDSAPIGNTEFPFRITIPANVAGFSTATFVEYRCMWRVEAIIHHSPISGIGTRQIRHFELPLLRYDLPPYPSPTLNEPYLKHQTTKPRAPRIRYSVNAPTAPIGPMDLIPVPIFLLPADSAVSIRSASALIERRITLVDRTGPPSPPATPTTPTIPTASPKPQSSTEASSSYQSYPPMPSHQNSPHLHDHGLTSTSSLSSSNPTITPNTMFPSVTSISSETPLLSQADRASPLMPGSEISSKVVSNLITGVESSGQFSRDAQNVWSKTLTLQWPAAKSNSRWATGETMHSALISVRYFVRVKIVVSSPTGTETIDLEEKELTIVSTNEPERQLALSKYNDMLFAKSEATRSKSKSPRRTKRDRDSALPSPAPSPPSRTDHTSSAPGSSKPKSSSSGRRPHTSAGPRDKAFTFAGARMDNPAHPRPQAASVKLGPDSEDDSFKKRRADARSRPETGNPTETKSGGFAYFFSSPRIATTQSGGSATSTTASSSSISSSSHGGEESDEVKAWEEELAKIEMRSRRSSDMLGFAGKRKRSAGAPRVVVAADPV